MSNHEISVNPRPRVDGLDIELLAQALLEVVENLPDLQRDRLAAQGAKLIAAAEKKVNRKSEEGAA